MTAAMIVAAGIVAAGIMIGVITIVSIGIRREERNFSLTRQAPDRMTRQARVLTGLWVRQRTDIESEFSAFRDALV